MVKITLVALLAAISRVVAATDEEQVKKPEIEHPQFTPYHLKHPDQAIFFDQFDDENNDNFGPWKVSKAVKNEGEFDQETAAYVGEWAIEEATVMPGFAGDKGLVLKSPAAHHAISAKFEKPLDNKDNTLVAQYEVKLQEGLQCGGAYLKLLSDTESLHQEEFSNASPYQIMFGPDKCGSTNKVHFIIRRKNPHTGEYEEKHLKFPPSAVINKLTNLYTLILRPDQTYEIRINGKTASSGSMLDPGTFKPDLNPPTEVDDPNDVKPADWIDNPRMPDPQETVKPADWDENEPYEIPDPNAVKPEDWDESMEELIPDPKATKPEDWDDEEDGEWVAPLISNPECKKHGCGQWVPPKIKNDKYRGKWVQPFVDNPDYKGEWQPRKIPNPDYYEDSTPANLEPIGAIGFELWTMQPDILFNDIYIGHSVDEAEQLGNATFVPKHKIEQAEQDSVIPPIKEPELESETPAKVIDQIRLGWQHVHAFVKIFRYDPKAAIGLFPQTAGAIGVTLAALLLGLKLVFQSKPVITPTVVVPTPEKREKSSTSEGEQETNEEGE